MFTLIQDDPLWVLRYAGSTIVNRVPVENPRTVIPSNGLVEPYQMDETSLILPSGVSADKAILIYTEKEFVSDNNLTGTETKADFITLQNPSLFPNTPRFKVMAKEDWDANSSFTLILPSFVYLAVREAQK